MQVFIHIGYHKTATTWLQRVIFPKHPGIEYWDVEKAKFQWITKIGYLHDFDFNVDYFRSRYVRYIANASKPVVISWEGFVGDPFAGASNMCSNAKRLKAVFHDAKIIVCIRNQLEMVESLYRQYVQEGGTCSLKDFLKLSPSNRVYFSLNYLRYDRLVRCYQDLFGKESVFVCLYEELRASPREFLRMLFRFIGVEDLPFDDRMFRVKLNRSLSDISVHIMRFANRFIASPLNPSPLIPRRLVDARRVRWLLQYKMDPLLFDRLFPRRSHIDMSLRRFLKQYFKSTNVWLKENLGLALDKYGYSL